MVEKYTLITGASSGIGKALAMTFARQGHHLILVARREAQLLEIQTTIAQSYPNVKVMIKVADLAQAQAREALHQATADYSIDVLINNAGLGHCNPFVEAGYTAHQQILDVNITALTHLSHLYAQQLKDQRGRLINIASLAAFTPGPNMAVYYASKAYVHSFSSAIKAELHRDGVSVTTVYPGPVLTEFAKVSGMKLPEYIRKSILNPSATQVADYTYNAAMARVGTLIPGWGHKLMYLTMRLTPNWLQVRLLQYLQKRSD